MQATGEAMTEQGSVDTDRRQQLWEAVLRTAVDPIIVIDEQGIILRANAATDRLLGYANEDIVGRNVSMLMPEPYRSEHDRYLARYLETGEARIIGIGRDVEAQRADGTVFPIALSVSEVELDDRRWFTGIIHDLSARREAENELRRARNEMEQRVRQRTAELEESMLELARSNRDLEQFAYIASHDLQTPLRNVRQGLELLNEHLVETLGRRLDGEAEELRDLTIGAAHRMEQLIQGLLSYSRLDRGGTPPNDPVDLRLMSEELIDQMTLSSHGIDSRVELDRLPTVAGDAIQLRQLLQNLLENAFKYRRQDRPLEVSVSAESEDGQWLISIGDNGIGIDTDKRGRVFELFRRAHPDYEGMGLGLAICQRIVERHGGEIWVTAGPNGGSVFSFTIPKSDSDVDPDPGSEAMADPGLESDG